MTVPALTTEAAVRELLDLEVSGSSKYGSGLIGSNILSASWFLERATERIFRDEASLTLKFTTNGAPAIFLPGLRTVGTVTLNGAALTEDSTFWLIPDAQQTGLSLAIQFQAFGQGQWDWRAIPDAWDRNLDHPYWQRAGRPSSLPNDLVIAAAWGYLEPDLPAPVRDAATVLAAFKTLRPDAFLSGARATEAGIFDLSQFPIEVQSFVSQWKSGPQAVGL